MTRFVSFFVWLLTTVQLVTVLVLIWAMAVDGPSLIKCLSAFVGE